MRTIDVTTRYIETLLPSAAADANTAVVVFTPSAIEVPPAVDAKTAVVAFTPSAVELQLLPTVDANIAVVAFTPSAVEVPPTIAPLATLTDTFDSILDKTTKWNDSTVGVVWDSSAGGRAKVPLISGGTNYLGTLWSNNASVYDLTGSYIFAALTPYPFGATSRTIEMSVIRATAALNDKLTFGITLFTGPGDIVLAASRMIAGSSVSVGPTSTPYISTTHKYMRIRESGGTIFWDTSPDGITWTNFTSLANPFAITRVIARFTGSYSGTFGPADAFIDSVNSLAVVSIDAGTIPLLLATSAVETREITEGATATFVFTPSAPAEVIVAADSATAFVKFTPSAVEFPAEEYVDANVEYLDFVPSSTDVAQLADSGSVGVLLSASAVELTARELVDANTEIFTLTASAVEGLHRVDAANVNLSMGFTSTDIAVFVETATEALTFTVSGTEVFVPGVVITDANTVSLAITTSASEVAVFTDATVESIKLTPSVIEVAAFVDANTVPLLLTANAVETREITDSAAKTLVLSPAGVEVIERVLVDAAMVPILFIPAAAEIREITDAATTVLAFTPTAVETAQLAETNISTVKFTATAVEIVAPVDADTELFKFTVSGIETTAAGAVYTDAITVPLALKPATTEIAAFVDTVIAPFRLVPSGSDTIHVIDDAVQSILFLIGVTTEEFAARDDTAITFLTLATASQEFAARDDAAITVVTLAAGVQEFHAQDDGTESLITLIGGTEEYHAASDANFSFMEFDFSLSSFETSDSNIVPLVLSVPIVAPYARDSFNRVVAAGSATWGTPDVGPAWTAPFTRQNIFECSGDKGKMVGVNTTTGGQVTAINQADVELLVRVSWNQLAVAAANTFAFVARYVDSSNTYRFIIGERSTNHNLYALVERQVTNTTTIYPTADLAGPVVFAVNDEFWFRARLIGARIQMRIWRVGTTEPGTWDVDFVDAAPHTPAASVGLRAVVNAGGTATPTYSFDDFSATAPGALVEIEVAVDANTVPVLFTVSGVDVFVPAGIITDADTTPVKFTVSSTEAVAGVDANIEYLTLAAGGADVLIAVETATARVLLTPSGTDVFVPTVVITDSGTEYLKLTPSGTDVYIPPVVYADTNSVPLLFSVSGIDIAQFADTNTERIALTVSGSEILVPPGIITDANIIPIIFSFISQETYTRVDQLVALVTLTPSSIEIYIPPLVFTDAATEYLRLLPSAVELFIPLIAPPKFDPYGILYRRYEVQLETLVYAAIAFKLYVAICQGQSYSSSIPYRRWWTKYDSTFQGHHRASAG